VVDGEEHYFIITVVKRLNFVTISTLSAFAFNKRKGVTRREESCWLDKMSKLETMQVIIIQFS